jgi:hypothetical protein
MKITIFAALAAVAAAKVQDNTHNVTYLGQKNLQAKTHGAIATTHYGNPLVGSCLSDETVLTVTGISGSFCSPPCHGTICPSDVPQFCTATPECALNDGGTKYCALECSDDLDITKAENDSCGEATCKPVPNAGIGICTYDSAVTTTHYGDPLDGPCLSDEENISISGVGGRFCSPACPDNICPTDLPASCSADPECVLQDSAGDLYCALECADDSECGHKATCKLIPGTSVGVCTYDS